LGRSAKFPGVKEADTKATEAASGQPATTEDIVVFITRREGKCAECGKEFFKGSWIRLEKEQPLCLACADLAHLEYLPRGNTALTRRATKYSPLRAVVVLWSRARQRYERQGIMVAPAAIRRAEEECLADAELRERRRAAAAERREAAEPAYVAAVTEAICGGYPGCPRSEAEQIAAWTCEKHSGRVGRSAAAKGFDLAALRLAVVAHIRHEHTRYDSLLMRSGDRTLAREMVWLEIERILQRWETSAAG
jgi:hypothetical protein